MLNTAQPNNAPFVFWGFVAVGVVLFWDVRGLASWFWVFGFAGPFHQSLDDDGDDDGRFLPRFCFVFVKYLPYASLALFNTHIYMLVPSLTHMDTPTNAFSCVFAGSEEANGSPSCEGTEKEKGRTTAAESAPRCSNGKGHTIR